MKDEILLWDAICEILSEINLISRFSQICDNFVYVKKIKVASNRKLTCGRLETVLHDTVVHTDALCQISGSWPVWFLRKMWQKFVHVKNILSCVKQEVDMRQIGNCVTRYSCPYWCSVPNIRKLAYVVSEKNVTENFVTPTRHRTTPDYKSDPYMSPPLTQAGDTITPYTGIMAGVVDQLGMFTPPRHLVRLEVRICSILIFEVIMRLVTFRFYADRGGGSVGRAFASHAEGWVFESRPRQT